MADLKQSTSRIPTELQTVFLTSNRGNEVVTPPPEQVASRVFFRRPPAVRLSRARSSEERQKVGKLRQQFTKTMSSVGFRTPLRAKAVVVEENRSPEELQTPESAPANVPVAKPRASQSFPSRNDTKSHIPLKEKSSMKKKRLPTLSPQQYVDALMLNRGYPIEPINTLETGYRNKPTQLQQASYHPFLISAAKDDPEKLKELLQSGLSPNPCNAYGESVLHMVCRRGLANALRVMMECGTELQVCDDYGRTIVVDVCWSRPAFDVVELLLSQLSGDVFRMSDTRGSKPLSYIHRTHWAEWIQFLESKKDVYWPIRKDRSIPYQEPSILREEPFTRPLPDPENALYPTVAAMVAAGRVSPSQAKSLMEDNDDDEHDHSECDDDSVSSDESSIDDEDDLEPAIMQEIIQRISASKKDAHAQKRLSSDEFTLTQVLESASIGRRGSTTSKLYCTAA